MDNRAPLFSGFLEIGESWIDYNNHLNMGYYSVIFDLAADMVFGRFGFGADYVAERNLTTFCAEYHVRYLRELKLGDKVRSSFWIVDHDEKRFHTFQELYHEDGWISATGEGLTLHIDLSGPKVAPMPRDVLEKIAAFAKRSAKLTLPEGMGGKVGMRGPRG
ncbi:MAG: thioesterase family protein [Roseovarius sp.]|nr:thioesterase family protein [Roseovarius sp.]MCY4291279.1 thioesterase family protein [Roseovarius sp.]MCY4317173.1 thioesterase family protein [Roseovarius sp.]